MNKLCARLLRAPATFNQYSSCVALGRNLSSYKSDLSLDVLYPQSQHVQFYTPPAPPKSEDGKFSGFIPVNQLKITYSRSSGPGGQNVNCVDTKVDLRFHVDNVDFISAATKQRIKSQHANQINKDGFFVLRNDVTRYQQLNLAAALERLREIIRALEKPVAEVSAETLERHRRKHEKAARERILVKRHRSAVKADRQNKNLEDF